MRSNAYFLAKFRFDTAENEPAKNLQNFAKKIANFAATKIANFAASQVTLRDAGRAPATATTPPLALHRSGSGLRTFRERGERLSQSCCFKDDHRLRHRNLREGCSSFSLRIAV